MVRLLPILMLVCFQVNGAIYYVKSAGGTGSGLTEANAWSFAKLNATVLAAGDLVLFKRGDVFYGQLTPHSGGRSGQPITYATYGSGPNPVITGLTLLSSWTSVGKNTYYTTLDVPSLNMVTLDGKVLRMGRYPNSGYLTYSGHSGNASISGTSVGALPFDPSGGEVVIRKFRWILDRHPIASRSNNTLRYLTNNAYGDNAFYSPVDGNGYFIQNHPGTLDEEGEWYYDKAAKRLYMHFGAGSPAGKVVKAGTVAQNLYVNYWTDLTFIAIDFEGGNLNGASVIGTSNITFKNCNFRQQGGNGVWASFTNNVHLTGGAVVDCLNNGICFEQEGNHTFVDGVRVVNSGSIAGAGRSGDGNQEGILITGNGTVIQNCSVINSGYIGINFAGNDVVVQRNFVTAYSFVKDDGAGIYTHSLAGVKNSNRTVKRNIVLNGVGAFSGAGAYYWENFGKAAGIYLDGDANHTTVDSNVVADSDWAGIFIHSNADNTVTNNLVYNTRYGALLSSESAVKPLRRLTFTGNRLIARTPTQQCLKIELYFPDAISAVGTMNRNLYARPVDDGATLDRATLDRATLDRATLMVDRRYTGGNGETTLTLAAWKSLYEQDVQSLKSQVTTSQEKNLRFDYNNTNQMKVIPLTVTCSDVASTDYSSLLRLAPYSGVVLIARDTVHRDDEVLHLTVYPNPTHHTIQARHPAASGSGLIRLLAVDGREVERRSLLPGARDTLIDVRRLSPGSYLIHLQDGAFSQTVRFVKQ